ncbi:Deoxyguanosine kinase, mitochondrial [Geodia barretti]|uniref:Deoxyguanosine kinase, mitochondrial n=1 Tax=Geodia barretti TaxID=519541 RepID=A0AA35VUV1_GEOBA|nr:Deoxyguanosine kinase, mitochondrial [Geodia barretti]
MAKRCAAGEGELQGNEEMISPAKKLCTSAVSGLRRIAVEGNIAAGKSTFLRLLKESSPAYHVISEPITKWQNVDSPGDSVTASQQCGGNLLDMFYREPKRWAYTFQTYACLSRLKAQLRQLPQEVTSQPNSTIFFERSVHSDKLVFAENCHDSGLLSDVEWNIYCDWHSFLLESLPLHFDAFIYLKTTPQVNVSHTLMLDQHNVSEVCCN